MSETAIATEFGDLSLIDLKQNPIEMDSNIQADLLKSIKLIGYEESLLSEKELSNALAEGPKSVEYTKIVSFLTNELRELCSLDEYVHPIAHPEDSVTFIMETSSFLKELGCPHEHLVQGHVSDRLSTASDCYLLLQHLITELMAARITRETRPDKRMDIKLEESGLAADLRRILQILGFAKPPKNITMEMLLQKLTTSIQNLTSKAHKDLINHPIFNFTLTHKQWETLAKIDQDLHEEYLIRREMLLKRLDCTIQSFQWSDRTKGKNNIFDQTYSEKRKLLRTEPGVGISDLLASREDLAIIEKTSSAAVRKNTKSSVNRVIIGAVPDRGGRTSEQAPPPPEMPPWQQRNAGPAGGGGGRGGFNQGGSNYSRGGGNSNYSQGGNSNYSQGGNYGNTFSNSSSFNRGGSNFNKDGGMSTNSYSQGNSNSYSGSKGSFDSAGSYGSDFTRGKNEYSQGGGNDYSRGRGDDSSRGYSQGYSRDNNSGYSRDNNSGYSRDSTGGYSRDNNSGYSRDNNSGYSRDSTGGYSRDSNSGYSRDNNSGYSRDNNSGYSQNSGSYSQGGYTKPFDSAGSYGQDYQEPKRAKTYDQFQQSRSTYADQYVQESQHNMQYQSRDRDNRNKGRGGRSNYSRGGGGASYR